jgi:hypothetical protein
MTQFRDHALGRHHHGGVPVWPEARTWRIWRIFWPISNSAIVVVSCRARWFVAKSPAHDRTYISHHLAAFMVLQTPAPLAATTIRLEQAHGRP